MYHYEPIRFAINLNDASFYKCFSTSDYDFYRLYYCELIRFAINLDFVSFFILFNTFDSIFLSIVLLIRINKFMAFQKKKKVFSIFAPLILKWVWMLMNTKKLLEKCKQPNIGFFFFFAFLFNDEAFEV